jgi:hypothetical protein
MVVKGKKLTKECHGLFIKLGTLLLKQFLNQYWAQRVGSSMEEVEEVFCI